MKMVSLYKLLCLYTLSSKDCVSVILSFLYYDSTSYKDRILRQVHVILKSGYNRTRVDDVFYRLWNSPESDCYWVHEYIENRKKIVIMNLNCVRCGNFESPFNPCTNLNMSITCVCDEFVELSV